MIALVAQFRLRRYVPGVFWLSVVLISVVGTLAMQGALTRNDLAAVDAE